jgi:hypothetical protein
MVGVDPAAVTQELQRAIQHAAVTCSSATDAREMQEAGAAALAFTQALVILDPTLDPQGVPLDHQLTMQAADHKAQAEQAQARAAAPTPARSVKPNG